MSGCGETYSDGIDKKEKEKKREREKEASSSERLL